MKRTPTSLKGLDFRIDKLTNSIENIVTGDSFSTEVTQLKAGELKSISKAKGWQFNWKEEAKSPNREVYKLTITGNIDVIQGLMSIEEKNDHIYMHLIESAPFNKGKTKMYSGVLGNLVAYACKLAFERGHEGNVAFVSKSKLIDHYTVSLGAIHIGGRIMILNTVAATSLVSRYFAKP